MNNKPGPPKPPTIQVTGLLVKMLVVLDRRPTPQQVHECVIYCEALAKKLDEVLSS